MGRGDFAIVYKVVSSDQADSEQFALKLSERENRSSRERLEREIAALRVLNHPNIPRLIGTGAYQDRLYVVMSLAPGKTLKATVSEEERTGALQGDIRVTEILCNLLDAVAHVHKRGLVHRDIKEANVLTSLSDSSITLIDFGFCKEAGKSEIGSDDSFFRVGAARFSPPSKLSNPGMAIAEHDVFAVGVLGYRLLTGDYPWSAGANEDVGALRNLQLNVRLTPVIERNPNVRPPVSQMISKLLRIRDEDRPSAIEALEEARKVLNLLRSSPKSTLSAKSRITYAHVIRDPIHGDIRLTAYETRALDTQEMQRLRWIRQLGLTNYVYGGADHSRLSHSIGCVARVEQILRTIEDRDGVVIEDDLRLISRLYALTHDVTHIPFGHTLEDEFGFFPRHDSNMHRAERLVLSPQSELGGVLRENEIGRAVLALFEDKPEETSTAVADLVSGITGADVLDYIDRDATYCGLDHRVDSAIFRQFQLQPIRKDEEQKRLVSMVWGQYGVRIDREEAVEGVVHERYKMFSKVYTHRTKIEASALLAKGLGEAIRPVERSTRPSLREEDLEQISFTDGAVLDWMRRSKRGTIRQTAEQLLRRQLPQGAYRARLLGEEKLGWVQHRYLDRQDWLREKGLLDPATRAVIEVEIADAAKLKAHEVMIYSPGRAPGHKRIDYWVTTSRHASPAQKNYGEDFARRHLGLWQMWVFVAYGVSDERRRLVGDIVQDRFGLPNDIDADWRQGRLW